MYIIKLKKKKEVIFMLDKLKDILQKTLSVIPKIPHSMGTKIMTYFLILLLFEVIVWNAGYFYNWLSQDKADIAALNSFVITLCGTFVSSLVLIGKSYTDSDGDGEADLFQVNNNNNQINTNKETKK
jgi:hypothetical protein|nr:MAG TPA: hypothetical protein [Caudoviricetes sp.]